MDILGLFPEVDLATVIFLYYAIMPPSTLRQNLFITLCRAHGRRSGEGVLLNWFSKQSTHRPREQFHATVVAEGLLCVGVKPIQTSPYHPQTDGLVECNNQTFRSMLRNMASGDGKDWDKFLPNILFPIMGATKFKLLYGRNARCSLDIVKEI